MVQSHAHHVKLAAHEPVLGEALTVQGREVVAGADHDRLGVDGPSTGLQTRRGRGVHSRQPQEGDAVPLGEVGGQMRDRVAQLNSHLTRTVEGPRELLRLQI